MAVFFIFVNSMHLIYFVFVQYLQIFCISLAIIMVDIARSL